MELQRQLQSLGQFLDHEVDELFEWRAKVKYGKVEPQLQRVERECKAWKQKIQ